jgi:hypothetical protein
VRVDIKAILANPAQRRELIANVVVATQAREGITTSKKQALEAYDRVLLHLDNEG